MNINKILITALILGIFAVLGTSLLSVIQINTKDKIADNKRILLNNSLTELINTEEYDNDILSDTISITAPEALGIKKNITVYRARKNGKPVAAIFSCVAPSGYSGPIQLLIGIYQNGTLAGVRVIDHKETPGLGDKIEIRRSNWIYGFNNKSLFKPDSNQADTKQWAVKKDGGSFDALSSATITSRAIIKAVYKSLLYFEKEKNHLFNVKAQ